MNEQEYYDVVALGYLSAVKRYFAQPKLGQYAFSTIAWQAMRRSVDVFQRAETQQLEAGQRYLKTMAKNDPMEDMEARLFLHDLASVASRPQYELATLRLQGCSITETARQHGMKPKQVSKLLKELYRAYCRQYSNEG